MIRKPVCWAWLAEQARLTKQAVGEVATELERLGCLERLPDPSDGCQIIEVLGERGRRPCGCCWQTVAFCHVA